ncbi:hypothetical protein DRO54_00460 [Candidatus Bathyarchaeota archaeon]|nr:MAG: hypothetical protein DRO54_00460 [Candidatus Bathyarchaeota archaeon]
MKNLTKELELNQNIKPTILKLGGSVITRKERPLTPNKRAIRRLAREISRAKVEGLIIVHGGGSFGHPVAKEYEIAEGFKDKSQLIGFSKTSQAMTMLNEMIVEALLNEGIPAVAVRPSSFIVTKHSRIEKADWNVVAKLLELGFVPVLYGDAVLDSAVGFTILSGDQLVAELAIEFNAERVIIAVDVDGIYTADPKVDGSAKLMKSISLEQLKEVEDKIGESKLIDVTGGMLGKINELTRAVMHGIPVLIVNGLKPNKIYKALRRERVVGTLITR